MQASDPPLSRLPETHQEYGLPTNVRYVRMNIFVSRKTGGPRGKRER